MEEELTEKKYCWYHQYQQLMFHTSQGRSRKQGAHPNGEQGFHEGTAYKEGQGWVN